MKITDLELEGLKLIELKVFEDRRGFFVERFNRACFESAGLPTEFAQDNHSRSLPGVLRGLHYQSAPRQSKLVNVVRGAVWEIVVDIRARSKTFGKSFGLELTGENGRMLWVPAGFAHGFYVLGNEPADLVYKVDSPYSPQGEGGIIWSDPDLQIKWPFGNRPPILSDRDSCLENFREYQKRPVF